jgi:hypothetical protein
MQRTIVTRIDIQSSFKNVFIFFGFSGNGQANPIEVIITSMILIPMNGSRMPPKP